MASKKRVRTGRAKRQRARGEKRVKRAKRAKKRANARGERRLLKRRSASHEAKAPPERPTMRVVEEATLSNGHYVRVWEPYAPLFAAGDALGVALAESELDVGPLSFRMADPAQPDREDVCLFVELDLVVHPQYGLCLVYDGLDCKNWDEEGAAVVEMFAEELDAFEQILRHVELDLPVCTAIVFTLSERSDSSVDAEFGDSMVFFKEDLSSLSAQLVLYMSSRSKGRRVADVPSLTELRERLESWASLRTTPVCDEYCIPGWFWEEIRLGQLKQEDLKADALRHAL